MWHNDDDGKYTKNKDGEDPSKCWIKFMVKNYSSIAAACLIVLQVAKNFYVVQVAFWSD